MRGVWCNLKIHIVQKGDTLWEIAKQYGVDFEELKQFNSHIASPDMIMPGMKIKIPSTTKSVKKETKKQPSSVTKPEKKAAAKVEPKQESLKHDLPKVPKMPMLGGDIKIESPEVSSKLKTDLKSNKIPQSKQVKEMGVNSVQDQFHPYTHPVMPVMPMCCCHQMCHCCPQMKQNHWLNMSHMKGPFMRHDHRQPMLPPETTGQEGPQWPGDQQQMVPRYLGGNPPYNNDPWFMHRPILPMYHENQTNTPEHYQPPNHIQPTPPGFPSLNPVDNQEEKK